MFLFPLKPPPPPHFNMEDYGWSTYGFLHFPYWFLTGEKYTTNLLYLIIHREKIARTTTNIIAERDAPYRPVCRFWESPAKMYQYRSILDLWGNLRKTGVTIALFILPKISLLALKSVGSNCVRVKEVMLLLAA